MEEEKKIIQHAGLRVTSDRLRVLGKLMKIGNALSVEDIIASLGKSSPDRVTVYRMMDQFAEAGIVKKVDLREGFSRFEFQEEDHHHHHIVCRRCNKIEHIHSDKIERAISDIESSSSLFSIVDDHSLEFFGICRTCIKK